MLNRPEAFRIAQEAAREYGGEDVQVHDEYAQELSNGWFFPFITKLVGSHGVIVKKQSGKCFGLGSAFPVDRDLRAYEAGFESHVYDIRLTKVQDRDDTLDFLHDLEISVIEPEFAHGVTWRIPRILSREELGESLEDLPHTFQNVVVYFLFERIEQARSSGCCEFELIETQSDTEA